MNAEQERRRYVDQTVGLAETTKRGDGRERVDDMLEHLFANHEIDGPGRSSGGAERLNSG